MAEAAIEENKDQVKSASKRSVTEDIYYGRVEKTVAESSYHEASLLKPYNPDDLYQKTGDYSIYEEMENDDQITTLLTLKRDMILSAGWDIVCDEEGQDEIKKDIEKALGEDPEVGFDELLEEIIDTFTLYGFSLSEKLFKFRDDQSLTLRTIKTRHPNTWLIHTDKHGNVERYEQRGASGDLDIKPDSLLHIVNNRKFQNPYGKSDLRAAYDAWFTKRQIIRFFAIFLEKYASPTAIATYDKNAPQEAIDKIHNAIKRLQTKTAITVPKDIELDLLESKSTGDVYEKALNIFNMFIGRAMLVPDLLGLHGSETGGGSLALGKSQIDIFLKHIQRRRIRVERWVNKHFVEPIVIWNWGILDHYPKFKLRPISEEDAEKYAKLWIEAIKGKFYEPSDDEINHFRKMIKFPQGEVVRVKEPVQAPALGGEPPNPNDPNQPDDDDKGEQGQKDSQEGGDASKEEEGKEKEEKKTFAFNQVSGDYHKKTNFKAIATHMDQAVDQILAESRPLVDEIFEDLYEQIERKKIIKNQNVERIDEIKLKKLGSLKQIIKKNLRDGYLRAKAQAQTELFKSQFLKPVAEDKFLEVIEAETFQFIGDWEYAITKEARTAMIAAIKEGRPLSSVVGIIDESGKSASMVSIERFARTKTTEVLNNARVDFFTTTKIVSGYQYSAILDDRSTEICRGLHGKKFKAGSEPIPPLHFNCRSVLIPITIYEEFTPDESVGQRSIKDFIDQTKGRGFSSK